MATIHTASDLAAAVRGIRPDAVDAGIDITVDWCRDQMHSLGVTRYEDIDRDILCDIAGRVDTLARRNPRWMCIRPGLHVSPGWRVVRQAGTPGLRERVWAVEEIWCEANGGPAHSRWRGSADTLQAARRLADRLSMEAQ